MIRHLRDHQTFDPQRGSFIVKARWNQANGCFEAPVDESRAGGKMTYSNCIEFVLDRDDDA